MHRDPPSRIHVLEATVRFVVADPRRPTGRVYRLTFDLTGDYDEILGSLYFGRDYLRAQGFVDLSRITEMSVEEALGSLERPGVTLEEEDGEGPAGCASRVAWHEERTCHWYDLR